MEFIRIAILGTRGFPGVQGGVEKHCQELYPRLAALGLQVTVFGRRGYIPSSDYFYRGVQVKPLKVIRQKHLEALSHTVWGLRHASRSHPPFDLVHIHAIGPGLMTAVARSLKFKIVVTHHGADYDRRKWSQLAKAALRLGEAMAARYAHAVISVSRTIQTLLRQKYGRDSVYIPNGVVLPQRQPPGPTLARYGLKAKEYILAVGRFVPEKGFPDLLEAFRTLPGDLRLAIAGGADHEDPYSRALRRQATRDRRVVLTGILTGQALAEIYSNARLFVLPSYHEGLPLALLEALSYSLPALVSAIPANLEVLDDPAWTFPPGDVEALRSRLRFALSRPAPPEWLPRLQNRLAEEFNWDRIAEATLAVYKAVLSS